MDYPISSQNVFLYRSSPYSYSNRLTISEFADPSSTSYTDTKISFSLRFWI